MKVAFYTLGCKVNQYDTQVMRDLMEAAGYQTVSFEDDADVYVVNTCTVTQISDKKSRQMVSRAKRNHPNSIIVICGCFAQVAPHAAGALEGVDIVLGTSNRTDILSYLDRFRADGQPIIAVDNCGALDKEEIRSFGEKNRAVLKIEDGCENYCSYCLIPYARGKIRSKPIEIIHKETVALVKAGFLEIVLTGIHLGSYGKENGKPCLEAAIKEVASIAGVERIRLGSLEPRIITPAFIEAIRPVKSLCPHFHLSLQSGCDKTLKAMNRRYTSAEYEHAVQILREAFPNCSITTDIIVGFPGETEDDFKESLAFADRVGFAKIHIFPYSKRDGTRAAKMEGQLSKAVKADRVKRMEEIEKKNRLRFWRSMIGTEQRVLPEEETNGILHGFTSNYCPVQWPGSFENKTTILKIIDICDDGLIASKKD
ncbi:MAG: tRNA (N(6)-L-threonylcarbamoyladenosine(37)-C(2))-methylthiotransferase MtaB [Clostridia bacterium]|nr:tRNA (N(6)-L-threonylcarbamoyladenosine(37)-C(2))-methylthiotransferase MtaB [Clostridia bacterium]